MARKKTTEEKPKPKPAASKSKTPVEAVKHTKAKRANIPTREQGNMLADDAGPAKVLYPRDPSLDPQLVWKGKDEQDAQPLEVPAVPIFIQEKIHPQALVEDLRARVAAQKPEPFPLFGDFNGLDPDYAKRTEFYHHDKHWTNRFILGDSLYVMTSLAEKERLKGKVQCIYFDPPYGIKFGSNWQVSTRNRDVKDAKATDLTRQPEQIKAFRDTWELGINSYLTYLRDRLTLAQHLLTESGSVFVQIGDENVHLVRAVCDEVLGSDNWIGIIAVQKTTTATNNFLPLVSDFLIWYGKNRDRTKYRPLYQIKELGKAGAMNYNGIELPDGTRRSLKKYEKADLSQLPKGTRFFSADNFTSASMGREKGEGAACWFPVEFEGKTYRPYERARWKTNELGMKRIIAARRVIGMDKALRYVRFFDDFPAFPIHNLWTDVGGAADKSYVVETTPRVIERCLLMTTDPGDLVLDPTCGSGTTAYVAEQWGRRWITIDTSRVALALARTRLMMAKFPYYLLADSPEGRKQMEKLGETVPASPCEHDIGKGFVYKKVPHVTLKSIANNPDIKEGMTRDEIDAAIRKHAETETLVDQPYEDKGVVRVTGPFTVESLSPHRVLPAGDFAAGMPVKNDDPGAFVKMIVDHLKKSGVQNTKRKERLVFDRLDLYPGEHLHAEGTYTESGQSKRVAVCIGPEFGTVGAELLQQAGREAHRGLGFDLLLVCGFAFDPLVYEEGKIVEKQVGKMKVLMTRMNPDLAMGDELLKKTGAGNLFMIFGEPDIDLRRTKDGRYEVELRGLDVFDPTTGEIRSSTVDDIACWFIDTDYNDESFFVRHAYFCGADDPFDKLRRALKADIDEAEWDKLRATTSQPFDFPSSGKIAVKVINHYGDEVLRIYPIVP